MDVLVICNTFTPTMPTSLCLLSVVERMKEVGHTCRILTSKGLIYDNLGNIRCFLDKGGVQGYDRRNPYRRVLDYIKLYSSNRGVKNDLVEILYKQVKSEISRRKPDVLVSSFGSIYALEAGCRIKEENMEMVYVPYFLDALLSGFPLRFMPQRIHDARNIDLENRLLNNADSVIMMKAAKKKHEEYKDKIPFYNKIRYLDIPLYNPQIKIENKDRHIFPENQTVIFYVGSMPRRVRDPRYFLQLFSRFQEPLVHLYIAGASAYMDDLKKYANEDNRIHLLGKITHEKAVEMQQEADFLLNIGNSLSGMIPSKVFEYMSAGKPIISTYRIPDDPIVTYLDYYQNALTIDENKNVGDVIDEFDTFLKHGGREQREPNEEQKKLLFDNTPDAVVEHLESLVYKSYKTDGISY